MYATAAPPEIQTTFQWDAATHPAPMLTAIDALAVGPHARAVARKRVLRAVARKRVLFQAGCCARAAAVPAARPDLERRYHLGQIIGELHTQADWHTQRVHDADWRHRREYYQQLADLAGAASSDAAQSEFGDGYGYLGFAVGDALSEPATRLRSKRHAMNWAGNSGMVAVYTGWAIGFHRAALDGTDWAGAAYAASYERFKRRGDDYEDWAEERFPEYFAPERTAQAQLLREIIGNPFRPARLDPAATDAGTQLAAAIYDGATFERLPELADVLQAAGCDDAGILEHCHGAGPHARGCWVVDLVLGKG